MVPPWWIINHYLFVVIWIIAHQSKEFHCLFYSHSLEMFDTKKCSFLISSMQKSSERKLLSLVHLHEVQSEETGSSLTSTPVTGSSQITLAESSVLRLVPVFVCVFLVHLLES